MNLGKIFSDLFTEANNTVVDLKRVASAAGIMTFNYLSFHAVVINHEKFDYQAFGLGLAAVIAAIGGALALGKRAESDPEPPP
jgi:hypothetical protein